MLTENGAHVKHLLVGLHNQLGDVAFFIILGFHHLAALISYVISPTFQVGSQGRMKLCATSWSAMDAAGKGEYNSRAAAMAEASPEK